MDRLSRMLIFYPTQICCAAEALSHEYLAAVAAHGATGGSGIAGRRPRAAGKRRSDEGPRASAAVVVVSVGSPAGCSVAEPADVEMSATASGAPDSAETALVASSPQPAQHAGVCGGYDSTYASPSASKASASGQCTIVDVADAASALAALERRFAALGSESGSAAGDKLRALLQLECEKAAASCAAADDLAGWVDGLHVFL